MKNYLMKLPTAIGRKVSKERLGMYDLKVHYKKKYLHNL